MDIYYPKDNAVSHGKVHELLDPEALKRGELLTEESIRWLLELHGEMYLIEQHYSTRTRMRRLALNGTPVAEFSDVEPMVDFQLGAANIRMSFTVRGNGIVHELFVNGKRFEDLTQALPSPIAARAEGSGMIFGAPLMSQRLGLLPPHLQPQPQPQQPPAQQQQQPTSQQQVVALSSPLGSSLSSLTQPISHDTALALLDDSYHSVGGGSVQLQFHHHHHHRRRSSQRISISLGSAQHPIHHHHHHHLHMAPHDPADIFASLTATSAVVAITPTPTTAITATTPQQHLQQQQQQQQTELGMDGFFDASTPAGTTAAASITTSSTMAAALSPSSPSEACASQQWGADMVTVVAAASSSLNMNVQQQQQQPHHPALEAGERRGEGETAAMAMVVAGGGGRGEAKSLWQVHGAGLLLRPSAEGGKAEEAQYFSSDDEAGPATNAMVVAAAPARGGGGRAARRRRGTTADMIFLQEDDGEREGEREGEGEGVVAMDTATGGRANRIVLPAFKVAKTSAADRPGMAVGTQHGSMPNLLKAAAAQKQQQQQQQGQGQGQGPQGGDGDRATGAVDKRRRGFERVLAAEEGGMPGAPPAIQRSLSASDVMGRPPNLKIIPPPPPTAFHRSISLLQQRGARQPGAVIPPQSIVQPPVCRPR